VWEAGGVADCGLDNLDSLPSNKGGMERAMQQNWQLLHVCPEQALLAYSYVRDCSHARCKQSDDCGPVVSRLCLSSSPMLWTLSIL
jgi:hypothetical protein